MKTRPLILFILLVIVALLTLLGPERIQPPAAQAQPEEPTSFAPASNQVTEVLNNAPLMFIENVGQFDERSRFQVRSGNTTLHLTDDGLWFTILESGNQEVDVPESGNTEENFPLPSSAPQPRQGVNLKLSFPDANPHPRLEPFERLETRVSSFVGNDSDQWHPDIPIWGGVRYVDLYPGFDLEVTSEAGRWNWRLVAQDGGNTSLSLPDMRLQIDGVDTITLDNDHLRLATAFGDFKLPLLQVVTADGMPFDLPTAQPIINDTEIIHPFSSTIIRPPDYVTSYPPTIPTQDLADLFYSAYLGGSSDDLGYSIAVDSAGNAYVTGYTRSSDFPTTSGTFDTTYNSGNYDAFVVKLNAAGSGLVYATFLGGNSNDQGHAIAVDSAGAAYLTGWTSSSDFPTTSGAFNTSHNGGDDTFIVKLNVAGNGLEYATFLGVGAGDYAGAIRSGLAVDGNGNAYVTGWTFSTTLPVTGGAFDTTHNGGRDAFVTKLNSTGSSLVYATYLGGSNEDYAYGLAVDGSGNAYVTGYTDSSDFPTTGGAFATTYNGGRDVFVTKLNSTGSALTYATFLGGSSDDRNYGGIAVDSTGKAYITGWTVSADFPTTTGAFDTTHNGGGWYWDTFVVKLNTVGSGLEYGTFLGGSNHDRGRAIAVDGTSNAYVIGSAKSTDFPTTSGAFDTSHNGNNDAFIVKLNAAGSNLTYATYLGGSGDDCSDIVGCAIAVDGNGYAYVTGYTQSTDFSTTAGVFDTTHNGGRDVFVAKLTINVIPPGNVAIAGHIGGYIGSVFVQGNYAYVGSGYELAILDITNPAQPVRVSYITFPDDTVYNVYVVGSYAYVGAGYSLRIVDVSNPTALNEIGSVANTGEISDLTVEGNYAYVTSSSKNFLVIDISNPTTPAEVGSYYLSGMDSLGVAVAGSYAYIAGGSKGLQVIDISSPANPTQAGYYDTPGYARGVAVADSHAYVADDYDGLRVVDVSNPATPTEIGFYDTARAQDVIVVGGYAYVVSGSGLYIIDVLDPANPTWGGYYSTSASQDVMVANGYAYIADGNSLQIVDVSAPTSPISAGFYGVPGDGQDVAVVGNYAYIADADGDSGLRVLDVSDRANPVQVGSYLTGDSFGIAVTGGYAYLASSGGLSVVDISDKTAPTRIGFFNTPGIAVSVAGIYAYIVDGSNGLHIIDVSDPPSPTAVSLYNTLGGVQDVAIAGSYAYVTNYNYPSGLGIVNISDPTTPTETGFYNIADARGVALGGNYAYVAAGLDGLRIIDISNPTTPTEIGFYNTPGRAVDVTVVGSHAYIVDDYEGLRVVDVSDPVTPTEVGFFDYDGNQMFDYSPNSVTVAGGYIYVTDSGIFDSQRQGSLSILRYLDAEATYSISGYVTENDSDPAPNRGEPIPDVTISNSAGHITTTDIDGYYIFPDLISGTYTITPTQNGYTFWPLSIPVTVPPQTNGWADFTGTLLSGTITISGQVTQFPDTPEPNVTIIAEGFFGYDPAYTTTTNSNGNYVLAGLPENTYSLIAEKEGFDVSPHFRHIRVPPSAQVDFRIYPQITPPPPVPGKPPLVLIHGWQGSGDTNLNCDPYNTDSSYLENIVVDYSEKRNEYPSDSPGWREAIDYWADMPAWLEEDYDVWVAQFTTGKEQGTPSLQENGRCLHNQINYIYEQTEQTQDHSIVIIGHSTGGLVSRACLFFNDCYTKVKSLITLGSPHSGLSFGSLALYSGYLGEVWPFSGVMSCLGNDAQFAVCQMSFNLMENFNKFYPNRPDVNYLFIGGGGGPIGVEFINKEEQDGLVGKYSAVGWRYPSKLPRPITWDLQSLPTRLWTDEVHSDNFLLKYGNPYYRYRRLWSDEGQESHAYRCLTAWLKDEPIPDVCEDATDINIQKIMLQNADSSLSQMTESLTGHLDNNQSITPTLQIDTNGASMFYLTWDTGVFNFDLIRPDGQRIDPAYAVVHPDEVAYEFMQGDGGISPSATYYFTSTLVGDWQLALTAGGVDASGANYRAFAALETDRTLTVEIDKDGYEVGDTVTFTATLQNNGIGLSGATATVFLARSDGVTETLILTEQGNGVYRTTYLIPDAPGFLPITVIVSGTDGGTPFTRQTYLLPTIAPHDAQLDGTYTDQARDNNGDGLNEILEVTVDVTAVVPGNYILVAGLQANGQIVAHTGVYTSLIAGTQTVILQFDGDEIRAAQLDGTYTVTNISLIPTELGISAHSADNVWITAAYSWQDFGSSAESSDVYLPIILKN